MITTERLPKALVAGIVERRILEGIDEVQYLQVASMSSIKKHGHADNQWEIWIWLSRSSAYVCLPGEQHELINNGDLMVLMAIKGHVQYTYDELANLLYDWGFSVYQGSLIVNEGI